MGQKNEFAIQLKDIDRVVGIKTRFRISSPGDLFDFNYRMAHYYFNSQFTNSYSKNTNMIDNGDKEKPLVREERAVGNCAGVLKAYGVSLAESSSFS
jgi:hypothetical protein